jgi:hypothetical protein
MRSGASAGNPEAAVLLAAVRIFLQHSSAVTKILLGVLLRENLPYRAKSNTPKVLIIFY